MRARFRAGVMLAAAVATVVSARDLTGKWKNAPAEIRQWYQAQVSPSDGVSCCSNADATKAEEDRREGHYWAKFEACAQYGAAICQTVDWMQVPDDVVLNGFRPPPGMQLPVVWWGFRNGQFYIRCFAPEPDA